VDECAVNNGGCSTLANCINTIGTFTCTCLPGYTGDGVTCTSKAKELYESWQLVIAWVNLFWIGIWMVIANLQLITQRWLLRVNQNRYYNMLKSYCLFRLLFLSIISTAYHLLSGSRAARLLINCLDWLTDWLIDWNRALCHISPNSTKIPF